MIVSAGICRWFLLLWSFSIWITNSYAKEIRIVCYYTNWSVYRPGTAKFSPQNINPYLCTHLIYAFGGFTKENTLKPFDKYQDIEKGGYAKFTGLKTYNKNLKTMLAIGGWNEGSSRFSPMVASPERRKELIKNSIKFLRQNHFDGLDLDWEYPSFRDGGKPRDKENYAKLVQELREEFERESEKTGRPRLLLTMAVPAGIEYVNKGYDIPKLTKYLDWMNILSYDYHSAFEPAVNHHAPLYSLEEASEYNYDAELNIDYTIKHYLEAGADPSKLVMGIPTYGRSYTLFNPDANEIGSPADGPGDMGEATRENGYLAYYEICENVKSNGWTVVAPNEKAMGPYAYKENQWVGYDDERIAQKKAEYVAKEGLGGIMFWAIDNDDFRGTCHGKPYPIIEAAKEALLTATGLTEDNLISPPTKTNKAKTRNRTKPKTPEETTETKNDSEKKTTYVAPRRRRIKSKTKAETTSIAPRTTKKKETQTTEASQSLRIVTPSYTTPAPPSTPDQGGTFKCEDEGFYPNPKDCKKYFWCLSGPGELGIVAHQFTCPAGLYFNKAADSCDYSQNVLCNKKLAKAKAAAEEKKEEKSKDASTTTTTTRPTSKAPPKITAATSRSTFRQTTTTTTPQSQYDEEYEYYDDEVGNEKVDSEEDPKVIKELLDLIKKAGGIEELEKQLDLHKDSGAIDKTTPSTRTKSIVEKFLSKTGKNTLNTYTTINRNSRGPQNAGLQQEDEKNDKTKSDRSKLQYTSISRQRSQSATANIQSESTTESSTEVPRFTKAVSQPQYISLRRIRPTTESPVFEEKTNLDRNKILGENENQYNQQEQDFNTRYSSYKDSTPQYVNIKRPRPSTTEDSIDSKYVSLTRNTSPSLETTPDIKQTSGNTFDTTSRYRIIQRTSSTTAPKDDLKDNLTTLRYQTLLANAGIPQDFTSPNLDKFDAVEPVLTASPDSLIIDTNTNKVEDTKAISDTPSPTTIIILSSNPNTDSDSTEVQTKPPTETSTPQLLIPRPFSVSSGTSLFTPLTSFSTTQKPKVSDQTNSHNSNTHISDFHDQSNIDDESNKIGSESNVQNKVAILDSSTTVRPQITRGSSRFTKNRNNLVIKFQHTAALAKDSSNEENETRSVSPTFLNRSRFSNVRRGNIQTTSTTEANVLSSTLKTRSNIRIRNNPFRKVNDSNVASKILDNNELNVTPRKVVRRFRVTTPSSLVAQKIHTTKVSSLRGRPFSQTTLANTIKLNAYKENQVGDSLTGSTNNLEETSSEEGENIKLSETNISENNNFNGNNILDTSQKVNLKDTSKFGKNSRFSVSDRSSTESNIIIRTRKIIRKLTPTESAALSLSTESNEYLNDELKVSTPSNDSAYQGRTRKIIRRLRPLTYGTSSTPPSEDLSSVSKSKLSYNYAENIKTPNNIKTSLRSRGRLRYGEVLRLSSADDNVPIEPLTLTVSSPPTENYLTTTLNSDDNILETESSLTTLFKDTTLKETTETESETTVSYSDNTSQKDDAQTTTDSDFTTLLLETKIPTTDQSDVQADSSTVSSLETDTSTVSSTQTTSSTTTTHRSLTGRDFRRKPFILRPKVSTEKVEVTSASSNNKNVPTENKYSANKRKRIFRPSSTTETNLNSDSVSISTTPKNRKSYRPSIIDNQTEKTEELSKKPLKTENKLKFSRFKYGKTTTLSSVVTDDVDIKPTTESSVTSSQTSNINKDALLLRNKNLFSKKRKMNIPIHTPDPKEETHEVTTEHLTTLFHVFAEIENSTKASENSTSRPTKVEKIVEVNRIVEVHFKDGNKGNITNTEDNNQVYDKIGAINRVTIIKVVDGNNVTSINKTEEDNLKSYFENVELATVQEIINTEKNITGKLNAVSLNSTGNDISEGEQSNRDDRKFEIYGGSKVTGNNLFSSDTKAINSKGAEIIDGISNIKIITPKSSDSETSTIALEGLFTTDPPSTLDNELLELENTRYVDIRILKQDEERSFSSKPAKSNFIPIKVLPKEDDVSMEAKVVEVTPQHSNNVIKIIPIQVAMARQLGNTPVVGLENFNSKISNTPFNPDLEAAIRRSRTIYQTFTNP